MEGLKTPPPATLSADAALLEAQCSLLGGRMGALWRKREDDGEWVPAATFPAQLADDPNAIGLVDVLRAAAGDGVGNRGDHVVKLMPEGRQPADADNADQGPHVFVSTFQHDGAVDAVSTILADGANADRRSRLRQARNVGRTLYASMTAGDASADTRMRDAIALLAISQEAEGFQGACLNVVNELARDQHCERVTLGWIRRQDVRVVAMSDTEELKKYSSELALIEPAMAECLDQQQLILYPVPLGADALLAHAVVHSHRKLSDAGRDRHVLSLPLRDKDEVLGVITLEREDQPFDPEQVRYLQMVADVLSIHLRDRRATDRWLIGHTWHSIERGAQYLVGPKHVGWKLLAVAVTIALLYVFLGSMPHKVTAPFVFEAHTKRVINAPYEAEVAAAHVEPGDRVRAGDALATLDVTELTLQLSEARANRLVSERERTQAAAEGDYGKVRQLEAEGDELDAQIALLEWKLDHAVILSPIEGVVITGTWRDRLGRVVDRQETMFEVADVSDLIAVLRVDEEDIDQVDAAAARAGSAAALVGTLTTRSQPDVRMNFNVERIIPAASPEEGENVVPVRAYFPRWSPEADYEKNDTVMHEGRRYRALVDLQGDGPGNRPAPGGDEIAWQEVEWLRPGMEGIARVEIGDAKIIWVATHKLTDMARLWLWW